MSRLSKDMFFNPNLVAVIGALFFMTAISSQSVGQNRDELVVKTGDAAPDGDGTYSTFLLNGFDDSGRIGFWSSLSGATSGSTGIFRADTQSATQIVRPGDTTASGTISFHNSGLISFHESGNVGFAGVVNGVDTILRGSGGPLTEVYREGELSPDGNGTIDRITGNTVNSLGQIGSVIRFTGTSSDRGVMLSDGTNKTVVARKGEVAPGGIQTFSSFSDAQTIDTGGVAFKGNLVGATGFFRGDGSSLTQIIRSGQVTPDGTISSFTGSHINRLGGVAVTAYLTGTSNGAANDRGIYFANPGSVARIAQEGQAAPDGNGTLKGWTSVKSNEVGQVIFNATLAGTAGGGFDDAAIYRGNGGALTTIVRRGDAVPVGLGDFYSFGSVSDINNSGQVLFSAGLLGGGATSNDNSGIWTSDGVDIFEVVRKGNVIDGHSVSFAFIDKDGLNEHGQVAYRLNLSNGDQQIRRWTPDLQWRNNTSGDWDTGSNWTLGLDPASVHDVFIDPTSAIVVSGPLSNTTVRSLTIGEGSGNATLNLQSGADLTIVDTLTLGTNGFINVSSGTVNAGTIDLSAPMATGNFNLTGGELVVDSIIGDVEQNGGVLRPGDSPGITDISGDYDLIAGVIEFEIGGLIRGLEFDGVDVGGSAMLDGTMDVDFINGFSASLGDSFLLVDATGGITGTPLFDFSDAILGTGLEWDISQFLSNGMISVSASAIPEPTSFAMFGFVTGVCMLRRRRRA